MADDYTPLTDEVLAILRDKAMEDIADADREDAAFFRIAMLETIDYWKRRAEAAEREALGGMPPMIDDHRGGRGPAGW